MAINLELPTKLHSTIEQARDAALQIFRPVSRKYDLAEHSYPVELDTLASLYNGLAAAGQAGAGRLIRRSRKPAVGSALAAAPALPGRAFTSNSA